MASFLLTWASRERRRSEAAGAQSAGRLSREVRHLIQVGVQVLAVGPGQEPQGREGDSCAVLIPPNLPFRKARNVPLPKSVPASLGRHGPAEPPRLLSGPGPHPVPLPGVQKDPGVLQVEMDIRRRPVDVGAVGGHLVSVAVPPGDLPQGRMLVHDDLEGLSGCADEEEPVVDHTGIGEERVFRPHAEGPQDPPRDRRIGMHHKAVHGPEAGWRPNDPGW